MAIIQIKFFMSHVDRIDRSRVKVNIPKGAGLTHSKTGRVYIPE